jgi:hypothetical protein
MAHATLEDEQLARAQLDNLTLDTQSQMPAERMDARCLLRVMLADPASRIHHDEHDP